MTAIKPTQAQLNAILASDLSQPVCMLNLLKFKDKATYPEDKPEASQGLSGFEAYLKYGVEVMKILETLGAKSIYSAPAEKFVIGQGDWDLVALVWYPSRQAFLEMTAGEAYQAIHYHREAGLAHQDLIETTPGEL